MKFLSRICMDPIGSEGHVHGISARMAIAKKRSEAAREHVVGVREEYELPP